MTQEQAERKVKGLQREFLARIEEHPIMEQLDANSFNSLRKRVFRGTFAAYRLGVIGIDQRKSDLYSLFFGWLEGAAIDNTVEPNVLADATEMCFRAALESYRIGAMSAAYEKEQST